MAALLAVEAAPDRPQPAAAAMIKVLIADHHAVCREGLKRILATALEVQLLGEAASAEETVRLAGALHPDIVIVEIIMPDRGAIQTLRELRRRNPSLKVLILTVQPEDDFVLRCLREGAHGYITKDAAPEEVIAALRRVAAGGKYVNVTVAEREALRRVLTSSQPAHESLSRREMQVLLHIAAGRTVGEVARELQLSVKTISTQRARTLRKLKLRNNAELMRYAIEHGLSQ